MDCSALITRQLAELAALSSRLQAATREQEASHLFRDLSNRAVLHVLSRERVLLPAWRQARWKDLPLDAFAAHVRFKQFLAELLVLRPADRGFAAALAAFSRQVEQLQAVDHGRLIPVLRDVMDIDQRRDLCNDIELLFEKGSLPVLDSARTAQSTHELLHEAEIVLSSLAPGGVVPGLPAS